MAILGHLKETWTVSEPWDDRTKCQVLADSRLAAIDALVFQCLQTVNRFELLPQIGATLARGPVVFDRYTASALVYGGLDGLDRGWIERINASLPQPDIWIYLDIPIEESFRRRPDRRDRYEADREYLEKVRIAYLRLFEERAISAPIQRGVEAAFAIAKDVPFTEQALEFFRGAPATVPKEAIDRPRWRVVDGLGTVEEVAARIWAHVALMRAK